jgi:hypothetical protein
MAVSLSLSLSIYLSLLDHGDGFIVGKPLNVVRHCLELQANGNTVMVLEKDIKEP